VTNFGVKVVNADFFLVPRYILTCIPLLGNGIVYIGVIARVRSGTKHTAILSEDRRKS